MFSGANLERQSQESFADISAETEGQDLVNDHVRRLIEVILVIRLTKY
jgi:hypothetical protein